MLKKKYIVTNAINIYENYEKLFSYRLKDPVLSRTSYFLIFPCGHSNVNSINLKDLNLIVNYLLNNNKNVKIVLNIKDLYKYKNHFDNDLFEIYKNSRDLYNILKIDAKVISSDTSSYHLSVLFRKETFLYKIVNPYFFPKQFKDKYLLDGTKNINILF